jgi:serpin B
MGMPDAFGDMADFSGMSSGVNIGAIIHKAVIEVNEKGSIAAAVTAITIVKTSAIAREIIFNADHPFVIVIREKKTGSILFIGTVMEPGN